MYPGDEPTIGIIGLTPDSRGIFSYIPDGTKEEVKKTTKEAFDFIFENMQGIKWKGDELTSGTINAEDILFKIASFGGF